MRIPPLTIDQKDRQRQVYTEETFLKFFRTVLVGLWLSSWALHLPVQMCLTPGFLFKRDIQRFLLYCEDLSIHSAQVWPEWLTLSGLNGIISIFVFSFWPIGRHTFHSTASTIYIPQTHVYKSQQVTTNTVFSVVLDPFCTAANKLISWPTHVWDTLV